MGVSQGDAALLTVMKGPYMLGQPMHVTVRQDRGRWYCMCTHAGQLVAGSYRKGWRWRRIGTGLELQLVLNCVLKVQGH